MPDEELFTIRLADGTHFQGTGQQIAAIEDDWHVELCKGEQPMKPELNLTVNLVNPDGTPFIPPLYKIEDGVVYREPDQHSGDVIRAIVREELAEMKKALVKDVLKQLGTEIRVHAGMISMNEARQQRGISTHE